MITIPKKYSLVSRDWVTQFDGSELPEGCDGITLFDDAITALRSGKKYDYTQHTFYHELVHQMLEAVGRPDLSEDEGLVDALAGALHQYLKTKRGNIFK